VIKKFVKGEDGAVLYDMNVKYIPGHNPDLVVTSADGTNERIDLTKFATPDALHALMTEKGIALKAAKTEL